MIEALDPGSFAEYLKGRAFNYGGGGEDGPSTVFAKNAILKFADELILFKNLRSFTFKQISLHPFGSIPVLSICETSCRKLTTSLFSTIMDDFQLYQNLQISNHYIKKLSYRNCTRKQTGNGRMQRLRIFWT